MISTHDDDLEARLVEIRSRPHWTWNEYDLDDIASEKQIATLDWMIEKRRLEGKAPPSRPPARTRSLVDTLLECGFVDGRGEGRERLMLERLEADLVEHVREINRARARSIAEDLIAGLQEN